MEIPRTEQEITETIERLSLEQWGRDHAGDPSSTSYGQLQLLSWVLKRNLMSEYFKLGEELYKKGVKFRWVTSTRVWEKEGGK